MSKSLFIWKRLGSIVLPSIRMQLQTPIFDGETALV